MFVLFLLVIHSDKLFFFCCFAGHSAKPDFIEPVHNVSVAVGRQATLSCGVNNLGSHQVSSLYFSALF